MCLVSPAHVLIVQTVLSPSTGLITSALTKYLGLSMDASFKKNWLIVTRKMKENDD